MSKFEEFMGKVKGDKAILEKVKKVKTHAMEEIIKIAKAEGIELKPEDFGKGELTEEALEKVAAAGGAPRGDCKSGSFPVY